MKPRSLTAFGAALTTLTILAFAETASADVVLYDNGAPTGSGALSDLFTYSSIPSLGGVQNEQGDTFHLDQDSTITGYNWFGSVQIIGFAIGLVESFQINIYAVEDGAPVGDPIHSDDYVRVWNFDPFHPPSTSYSASAAQPFALTAGDYMISITNNLANSYPLINPVNGADWYFATNGSVLGDHFSRNNPVAAWNASGAPGPSPGPGGWQLSAGGGDLSFQILGNVGVPQPPADGVPEPGTIALAGLGAAAIVRSRRRGSRVAGRG